MSDARPDPATGAATGPATGAATGPGTESPEGPAVPTFPPKPLLRTGYDRGAVDEFATMVALAVHNERQTRVTADDIAQRRFPARRLGPGYAMREVDDYLGVAEALLRARATASGTGPDPEGPEEPEHAHHPTWWIYAVAALLAVVIVVFTLTQT